MHRHSQAWAETCKEEAEKGSIDNFKKTQAGNKEKGQHQLWLQTLFGQV